MNNLIFSVSRLNPDNQLSFVFQTRMRRLRNDAENILVNLDSGYLFNLDNSYVLNLDIKYKLYLGSICNLDNLFPLNLDKVFELHMHNNQDKALFLIFWYCWLLWFISSNAIRSGLFFWISTF